jgi:hypothetical protein
MRLPITSAFLLSLSAGLAFGQGTVRFEWVGNQNQVHGGFDVTVEELHGLTNWGSTVLLNSIAYTDFYGVAMSPRQDFCEIWGTNDYQGWSFAINLWDFNRGLVLHTSGNQSGTADYIAETDLGGTTLAWENGTWHYYLVPEPNTPTLLGLGALCLALSRAKLFRGKPPNAPVSQPGVTSVVSLK